MSLIKCRMCDTTVRRTDPDRDPQGWLIRIDKKICPECRKNNAIRIPTTPGFNGTPLIK